MVWFGVTLAGAVGMATAQEPDTSRPPPTSSDILVGTRRRFGLGVAVGFPPSVTAKIHVSPRDGVAVHVGATLASPGLHVRLQYEGSPRRLESFEIGDLLVTWHAGAVVNLPFGSATADGAVRPGVIAGAGAEIRMRPAPVGLFGEASVVVFPLDFLPSRVGGSGAVGVGLVVGARWYFGDGRPPPPPPIPLPDPPGEAVQGL